MKLLELLKIPFLGLYTTFFGTNAIFQNRVAFYFYIFSVSASSAISCYLFAENLLGCLVITANIAALELAFCFLFSWLIELFTKSGTIKALISKDTDVYGRVYPSSRKPGAFTFVSLPFGVLNGKYSNYPKELVFDEDRKCVVLYADDGRYIDLTSFELFKIIVIGQYAIHADNDRFIFDRTAKMERVFRTIREVPVPIGEYVGWDGEVVLDVDRQRVIFFDGSTKGGWREL